MSAPGTRQGYQRLLDLPADELQLLKDRARDLARPLLSDDEGHAQDAFELLEVHTRGQLFGLPLSSVEGIGDLTAIAAIPRAPAMLKGIVTFRGELLLGIELSTLLDSGASAGIADLRRVVVIAAGGLKAAVLAERVVSIRSARPSSFARDKLGQRPFVQGVDTSFVTLLEPGLLLQHAFERIGGTASTGGTAGPAAPSANSANSANSASSGGR